MSLRQLKITKSITNRESQSLEKYLLEISKLALVHPDDEAALTKKIKSGDERALEKLIKANLRFVVSVAKQYQNQGLSLCDLINEGNIGLLKAASKFDETKGFKFISYAVWWIRQSIMQALAEQSRIVRLPANKVDLTKKLNRAFQLLEQEYEREPTPEELAEFLEIEKDEIVAALNAVSRHISVDNPSPNHEEFTLVDVLENPNAERADMQLTHCESMQKDIERLLHVLTEKQKNVLCYFFGIGVEYPLTLEDIGQHFHLTRERVRQIKDKAIDKLKSTEKCSSLRVYL
ncbi:MAG: sigma-70 family RNA polymerase sigma factor [Parafilimonas sp.]